MENGLTWEEIVSILVKTDSHNAVGCVEGLLNTISVVYIDIDVQNPRVVLQQFENCKYEIINIAKSRGLSPFCVMQTPCPVDGDVALPVVQSNLLRSPDEHPSEGDPGFTTIYVIVL